MKKLLLLITLLLPILSQSKAFAQIDASEQERNREMEIAKLHENDYSLVVGQYEGNTTGSEQYNIKADIHINRIIVAGMSVPQPILTGVLNITSHSNENMTFAFAFNTAIYDVVSQTLTFHVPGIDGTAGIDVQCIRNIDESLACDWPRTTSSSENFKFTLVKTHK